VTPEEIAKRYSQRPGYRLADYAEVGLPIYSVTIRALTIARKHISPIEEFILKCVDRGLTSPDEIAQFLGLELQIIKRALVNLAQTDSIALRSLDESRLQSLQLTGKGKSILEKAEIAQAEERMFQIHFDGLLKRVAWYGRFQTVRFEELEYKSMIEIQSYPPRRPRVSDLELGELGKIIRALGHSDEYKRELIAVKSIEKAQKYFLPAVALVYISSQASDVQVAFAVDGKLSPDHEIAFAQMEGPRKQGITKAVLSRSRESGAVDELRESLSILDSQSESLEKANSDVELQLENVKEDLVTTEDDQSRTMLREKLSRLEEEHSRLKEQLGREVIRNLYTIDHPPLLEDALCNASKRLMIISPWIRGDVVDSSFLQKLEGLLKKRVDVFIGYGISEPPTERVKPQDQKAKDNLQRLAQNYHSFRLVRLGNTHSKVLIKDSDYAVIGSFNWLSFRGESNRPFRDEQSVKIQRADLVEQKYQELVGRFPNQKERTIGGGARDSA
jgi:hypothetical protein